MVKCFVCKRVVLPQSIRPVCKICRDEMFGVGEDRRVREPTPASATAEQAEQESIDDKRASDT